jgi:hypothetical protein
MQHLHQPIHGVGTDVVIQRYSDRTFVLVTQLAKIGNLVPVFRLSRTDPS